MLDEGLKRNFDRRNAFSKQDKILISAREYDKLQTALENKLGSWEGFNLAIDLALAIAAADGAPSYDEYLYFKQVTKKSPTYDEFYSSTANVSHQFKKAISEANRHGKDIKLLICVYALGYYAIKGYINPGEEAFLNDLLYSS